MNVCNIIILNVDVKRSPSIEWKERLFSLDRDMNFFQFNIIENDIRISQPKKIQMYVHIDIVNYYMDLYLIKTN